MKENKRSRAWRMFKNRAANAKAGISDAMLKLGCAFVTVATGGAMAMAATPMAYAATGAGAILGSMMGLVEGGLQFGGAIVFGIGLIIFAVNIRGDSPGGAPLIGAISMMIIGGALFAVGLYWGSLDTNWADQVIG